jgi:hypothetical protein
MGPKEFNMPTGLVAGSPMEYRFRILEDINNLFMIQKRFLFFWITTMKRVYHHSDINMYSYSVINYFNSIREAEKFIEKLKIKKIKPKRRVVKYII